MEREERGIEIIEREERGIEIEKREGERHSK